MGAPLVHDKRRARAGSGDSREDRGLEPCGLWLSVAAGASTRWSRLWAASHLEPDVYAAPGNAGTSGIAIPVDIPVDDYPALRDFARENEIDLTVVGPEDPLIGGISDCFWKRA